MSVPCHNMLFNVDRMECTLFETDDSSSQPALMYLNPSPDSGCQSPPQNIALCGEAFVSEYDIQMKILEQPTEKFRFRYKSEMAGTHGSLSGRTSDRARNSTFPTVQLCNYSGNAIIRCMMYQHGETAYNNKPHAHRLIKKCGSGEVDDPHEVAVSAENNYTAVFQNMGIIHTAKKNLVAELVRKKEMLKLEDIRRTERVERDLTRAERAEIKSEAENETKKINLNIVCLRFDAFRTAADGILESICPPVYSEKIFNLKSAQTGELKIVRMDHCTSPANGGKEIFILVEKVTKKNIKIRFYEEDEGHEVWQDFGKFNDIDVHHQYAIVFKTPPYKDRDIDYHVKVFIELVRPSDGARSDPLGFTYTPSDTMKGTKRARVMGSGSYSSSFSSAEIPVPIKELNIASGSNLSSLNISEEFGKADGPMVDQLMHEYFKISEQLDTDGLQGVNYRIAYPQMETRMVVLPNETEAYLNETYKELYCCVKTRPTTEVLKKMLLHYFDSENSPSKEKYNPLHMAVLTGKSNFLNFFIRVISKCNCHKLLNHKDADGWTPLHHAAAYHHTEEAELLLKAGADPKIQDNLGNTPLHIAIKNWSGSIIRALLTYSREVVDIENNEGDAALDVAIDNNSYDVIEILYKCKADVNRPNKKNGFTALRKAVEKHDAALVKLLLQKTNADVQKPDFSGITPFNIAKMLKETNKSSEVVYSIIEDHLKKSGIVPKDVQIKEEEEDISDEEEMEVDPDAVKSEPLSIDDIRRAYSKVESFTKEHLDEVCEILDASGNWEHLACLLDMEMLLKNTELFEKRPTRNLLLLALTKGESLYQIREFLEHLDETRAVQIMDSMVLQKK